MLRLRILKIHGGADMTYRHTHEKGQRNGSNTTSAYIGKQGLASSATVECPDGTIHEEEFRLKVFVPAAEKKIRYFI